MRSLIRAAPQLRRGGDGPTGIDLRRHSEQTQHDLPAEASLSSRGAQANFRMLLGNKVFNIWWRRRKSNDPGGWRRLGNGFSELPHRPEAAPLSTPLSVYSLSVYSRKSPVPRESSTQPHQFPGHNRGTEKRPLGKAEDVYSLSCRHPPLTTVKVLFAVAMWQS
jgi:hypothetical protein